jgi:MFS family permease
MIVGLGLMTISALTGINTVIFYSSTIFTFAGFDNPILATTTIGLINVLSTFVATLYSDKYGRKALLLIGTTIMLGSLILLTVDLLYFKESQSQGYIAVISTLIFVIGFAMGIGPVSWVVMTEILHTRLRSKAFGLFLQINSGFNLVIGAATLTAIDALGGIIDEETEYDDDDFIQSSEKKGLGKL